MQGSVHQALTLTVSGNAFLQRREIGPFWPENDAFVFCREVRFVKEGPSTPLVVAADPEVWLKQLAEKRAGLKFHLVPRNGPRISDMMAVGFANGGARLLIEAIVPDQAATCWEGHWELTDDPQDSAPDRRIWSVTYSCLPSLFLPQWPAERSLVEIEADLAGILEALADFVERAAPEEAMPGWIDNFRSARSTLEQKSEWRRSDPSPAGFLSSAALRLLHAAQAGWVFGGMGAWNDGAYWGSAEAEGDRLSEALFALLNEAVPAVANSSFRAG